MSKDKNKDEITGKKEHKSHPQGRRGQREKDSDVSDERGKWGEMIKITGSEPASPKRSAVGPANEKDSISLTLLLRPQVPYQKSVEMQFLKNSPLMNRRYLSHEQ